MGRYGKQMSPTVRRIFFLHIGNMLFMPEPSVLKVRSKAPVLAVSARWVSILQARPFYLLRMDPTYPEGSANRRRSSRLSFLRAASPSQDLQMQLKQPMSWMTQSDTLSNSEVTTPDPTVPTSAHFLNVPSMAGNNQPSTAAGEHSGTAHANVARLSSRVNNLIESIAMTEQKRETILLEWQWLAMLLDRLFLIFFLASLVIMTAYLFIVGYVASG